MTRERDVIRCEKGRIPETETSREVDLWERTKKDTDGGVTLCSQMRCSGRTFPEESGGTHYDINRQRKGLSYNRDPRPPPRPDRHR